MMNSAARLSYSPKFGIKPKRWLKGITSLTYFKVQKRKGSFIIDFTQERKGGVKLKNYQTIFFSLCKVLSDENNPKNGHDTDKC